MQKHVIADILVLVSLRQWPNVFCFYQMLS